MVLLKLVGTRIAEIATMLNHSPNDFAVGLNRIRTNDSEITGLKTDNMTPEEIISIVQALENNTNLSNLDLNSLGNSINDVTANAIATAFERPNNSIKNINISGIKGYDAILRFLTALRTNNALLSLTMCHLGDAELVSFVEIAKVLEVNTTL
jgi:hypothetical protein